MIRKSGYRFSVEIMLKQGSTRLESAPTVGETGNS
jgi:hypothetical protein